MPNVPVPLDLRKLKVFPLASRRSLTAIEEILVDPESKPPALPNEFLRDQVALCARQIREALKAGTPIDKAIEPSGLKLERIPELALVEPPAPTPDPAQPKAEPEKPKKNDAPDLSSIKSAVSALSAGEVSDFVPVAKGGLVAVLEKRAPADPAGFAAANTQFETRYVTQRRGAIFIEWMHDRRKAANASLASTYTG